MLTETTMYVTRDTAMEKAASFWVHGFRVRERKSRMRMMAEAMVAPAKANVWGVMEA
jgi:hypothetical protein